MEWLTLACFCTSLLLCIIFNISILYALTFGLVLFWLYGKHKGFSWSSLARMTLSGISKSNTILYTFILIGILTALWRAAGTIPLIVCYATELINPSIFLLVTFLLNCLVSAFTGTSFGTVATIGVICATMSSVLHIDLLFTGGAILSGIYYGDRCSPVSTSALLIAELTKTDIFQNIKLMFRSSLIPFLLTCFLYACLGFFINYDFAELNLQAIFQRQFHLSWIELLPVLVILLLSVLRVNVKITMITSILISIPLCLFLQHIPPELLFDIAVFGFYTNDSEINSMLSGGGILSMLQVCGIVCLSSSYSDIFQKTGLLDKPKQTITNLSSKTTPYAATLFTSIITGIIACNQTFTIILTNQLCQNLTTEKYDFANNLEDTAVVVSPLIPWSIACSVPLASIEAPNTAILFAFYLYLLPAWRLLYSLYTKIKT